MSRSPETPTETLRLREHKVIRDGANQPYALFDVEQYTSTAVPRLLRSAIAQHIGDACENATVRQWLLEEEFLTEERFDGFADDPARSPDHAISDISLDIAGLCNLGCDYCFENDIDSRTGPISAPTLESSIRKAFDLVGGDRLVLHFGSGEPLTNLQALQQAVDLSLALGEQNGVDVKFELTTNATLVTPDIASFLARHPFNVRVSFDGPAEIQDKNRPILGGRGSYRQVETGLRNLLRSMPDRVTVNSVIAGPDRLLDIWNWAKALGLPRLHVIKVGAYDGSDLRFTEDLELYRQDNYAIADEIIDSLARDGTAMDYQPFTKIARRMMIPQRVTRFCGVAGSYLGISSQGKVYPCFRHIGLERYLLGDVAEGEIDSARRSDYVTGEAADVGRDTTAEAAVTQTPWSTVNRYWNHCNTTATTGAPKLKPHSTCTVSWPMKTHWDC